MRLREYSTEGLTIGVFVCVELCKENFVWDLLFGKTPTCDRPPFTVTHKQPVESAAVLSVLPEIVEITADAFPHSAGEAAMARITHKEKLLHCLVNESIHNSFPSTHFEGFSHTG